MKPPIICVVLFTFLANAKTLDSVHVNKCCKSTEILDKQKKVCLNSTIEDWTIKYLTMNPTKSPKLVSGLPKMWKIREDTRPNCKNFSTFHQRLHSFVAIENGSLFVTEIGTFVLPSSYCVDYDVVLVCITETDSVSPQRERVNRCCGENAVYSLDKRRCDIFNHNRTIHVPNDTVLVDSLPDCTDYALAGQYSETSMLTNGSLKSTAFDTVLPSDSYCIEYMKESNDELPGILVCRQHIIEVKPNDIRFIIYPIALSLSVIFLAATLIASFLMPASHHVLHWRCQTNYVLCLLLGKIVLCIIQFSGSSLADLQALCTILAFSMHFLFLSAFFWLNTMCFNIWWTFRDLRPQNLEKSQERCRLRLYVVYACGFPAVIAVIGLILDLVGDENTFYQPGFGKNNCWFQGNMEIMLYFFIPVGILLAVNLALFIATARELTCGLWKRELVKSTTERAALGRVCLKLVIVMGVFWIADIISWAVGGPHEYWYSTDIFNCLQGVFIFIVVGCQPQVLAAVKRYWCWRRGSAVETAGTTNHHSSTSQGQPSMGDTMCNHSVSNTTKSIALETSC
ncbi:probable G-protein coupled receptor Mth-like 1 isoform X1 [Onthophagus taurus]|uniref:probable G-protein coupled receptor Mth-like 1 isoform X1 n=1 Tax=Onthophagus taurus TaxID=166361 RepID=UPI0039BE772D